MEVVFAGLSLDIVFMIALRLGPLVGLDHTLSCGVVRVNEIRHPLQLAISGLLLDDLL